MKFNTYRTNKLQGITWTKGMPTMTDQSASHETDINVIVKKFPTTGTVPGAPTAPRSGDFTGIPADLRSLIDLARSAGTLRRRLPKELQGLTNAELLALTPDQIKAKITPPVTPTDDKPKEDQK